MHPAYFALVMATGIVSIASRLLGLPIVPEALLALNLVFYPVLWLLTLLRALRHGQELLADLSHHGRLAPSDLAPPYWINMGAAAVSTLAGTLLIAASSSSPVVDQVLPFVRGFTLMWWATATWWIPMLLVLGMWRHGYRRFPLSYDPLYWGALFPLGMYTVATVRLSGAVAAPFLFEVARYFVFSPSRPGRSSASVWHEA